MLYTYQSARVHCVSSAITYYLHKLGLYKYLNTTDIYTYILKGMFWYQQMSFVVEWMIGHFLKSLLYASNKLLTLLLLPHAYSTICVQLIQILVLPFLLVVYAVGIQYIYILCQNMKTMQWFLSLTGIYYVLMYFRLGILVLDS